MNSFIYQYYHPRKLSFSMSAYEKKRIELGRSKRRGAPQTYP